VRRYYPISGTPTFDVTYGASRSIDANAYRTGGTSTYSVPTAITENDYCSFQPDIEPFYSIKVLIPTKGTGDWTLTLHDGLNNVLATSTVTNANITSGQLNEFVFSSQVRALVKPNARTYHFHLTSTVADGTVTCSTTSNLNSADFELWAYRLVDTVNGLHPMVQFQQFTLIGNGNYVAVWEPLTDSNPPNNEFQRHRLVFPSGYEVCGIAASKGFAYIALEKKATNASKDFQDGLIIKWDGSSNTYDDYVNVTGGSPQSISIKDNLPYFYVSGALHAWPGGDTIVKVHTIANTSTDYKDTVDNTQVYPNMITVRDNVLHAGYPSTTNNTSIKHGVYTFGSLDKNYPSSFGYSYVISTQTKLNTAGTLQLGCVRNFGDEMYISWKDGTAYGLDIVDSFCDPAPTFKFRSLQFDAGLVRKRKKALRMAIDTEALPSGVTITPVYNVDNSSDVSSEITITSGGTEAIVPIDKDFRRIIVGFDGTSTAATPPVILAQTLEWNPLPAEKSM
jgi:hypothetical protein